MTTGQYSVTLSLFTAILKRLKITSTRISSRPKKDSKRIICSSPPCTLHFAARNMQTHLHITISFTFYTIRSNWELICYFHFSDKKKGKEGVEGVEAFFNSLSPPLISELVLGTHGFPPPCSRTCEQPGLTMLFLHG